MKRGTTIAFLLFPKVHLMDLAGPAQVFYEANQIANLDLTLKFISLNNDVRSEQGLQFTNLCHPDLLRLTENDFLVIPGIDFKAYVESPPKQELDGIRPWLEQQFATNVQIATICSGVLIPALLGLIQNKACTTHWKCVDYLKAHYPKIRVLSDQLFVKDQNFYSSAGMTSGIDMCLAIIEELHGPILASKIAREMVIYLRRNHESDQEMVYLDYQTHFNPAIHRAQNYIISNPIENPSLVKLAQEANMSQRNLTRTFKEVTNHTITEFKHEVKLALAKTFLNNPNFTIEAIAAQCGYKNARQLQRIWHKKYGQSLFTAKKSLKKAKL